MTARPTERLTETNGREEERSTNEKQVLILVWTNQMLISEYKKSCWGILLFSFHAGDVLRSHPRYERTWKAPGPPTRQPTLRAPRCHLRIMGKECSRLLFVLIISDVEEMEGLWVDASATAPQGEEGGEGKREEKVDDDREERRGSWGTVSMGMRRRGSSGPSGTRGSEEELEKADHGGSRRSSSVEEQMLHDATQLLCCFIIIMLRALCPYQARPNILTTQSRPEEVVQRKLMEDVTNHTISDQTIVNCCHDNNLECFPAL